jgi:hypothetical protein
MSNFCLLRSCYPIPCGACLSFHVSISLRLGDTFHLSHCTVQELLSYPWYRVRCCQQRVLNHLNRLIDSKCWRLDRGRSYIIHHLLINVRCSRLIHCSRVSQKINWCCSGRDAVQLHNTNTSVTMLDCL